MIVENIVVVFLIEFYSIWLKNFYKFNECLKLFDLKMRFTYLPQIDQAYFQKF